MEQRKLAKQGNGAKVHVGYNWLNDSGKVHHVALNCDYFPFNPARLVGEIEDLAQITCKACLKKYIASLAH